MPNISDKKNFEIQCVRAETYDKCIQKIKDQVGTRYTIQSFKNVPCTGFFNGILLNKQEIEVAYCILPEPSFEAEQKKILSENSKRLPSPEITEVIKQIAALKEEILYTKQEQSQTEHQSIQKIENLLEKNEFSPSYIKKMTERLRKDFSLDELEDFNAIQNKVVEWIGESFSVTTVDENADCLAKPHVMIVVGPTGVGKTTTVAKLAANFVMKSDIVPKWRRVHIITIDRFRIAAEEQIKKYAQYLEVPVSVCEKPEDIKDLVSKYRDETDVFIIDTIGYSPKDYENIAKMRRLLDITGLSSDVYLAFSAAVKTSDLRDILKQYEIFDYNSVIVTKFDETNYVGNIVSVISEKHKPISFITNGQKVPRDIEKASVVRFLTQLTDFNIDRLSIEQHFSTEIGDQYGRSGI